MSNMTLKMWETLLYVAIIVLVISEIILFVGKFVKNHFYHEFKEDELIKTTKTSNSFNKLYFTHGVTSQFIRKYVLCTTPNDKYIICNYAKEYSRVGFFVLCYNKRHKVIRVIRVEETSTTTASSIVSVHKNTKYVNVVIGSVNDRVINKNIVQPLKIKKIRIYSLLKSISMFATFFILRHAVAYLFTGPYYLKRFLLSEINLISVIVMAVVCVFTGIIRSSVLRKRNVKASKGGVIEYEFI